MLEGKIPQAPPLPPAQERSLSGYSTNPRPTFEPVKLHFAINKGDFEGAKKEVERGININYTIHGNTPIILSIIKEHYNIAILLAESGADVTKTEKTKLERQPLHIACKIGALEVVKILVKFGASVHACDNDSNTSLSIAAYEGHKETVQFLCSAGAHINTKDGRGKTPLFNAVENDHIEIVKILAAEGAFVNTHDSFGWTPLIHCIMCGYVNLAKYLITNGANVNDPDRYGETPLHFACARLTSHHMRCLCRANIDYYTRHLEMVTPILRKALCSTVTENELVSLLVDVGCNINVLDGFGQSPLFIVSSEGNAELVQYLVNAGAQLSEEDWIAECQWPPKLAENQSICNLLSQMYTIKIRSLQDICKFSIRYFVGRTSHGISNSIMALPIPGRLKNFLHVYA